jgi:hypothetical protein
MRSNQRANITIDQDAMSVVRLKIATPQAVGLATEVVLAGADLYALADALGKITRRARKYEKDLRDADADEAYRLRSQAFVA